MNTHQLKFFRGLFTVLLVLDGMFFGGNIAGFIVTHNYIHLVLAAMFVLAVFFVIQTLNDIDAKLKILVTTKSRLQEWVDKQ
jgi:hypothetical protein